MTDHPDGDLLIYDGDCAFCRWTLERGRAILPRFPQATAYQACDLRALGLTTEQASRAVQLRTPSGRRYAGHRAIGMILLAQPALGWRLCGGLVLTPPTSWLAALGYRLVARYRGRLWSVVGGGRGNAAGVRSEAPTCST